MNLDEIRTFLAIVGTGSLVAAARRLNVTPSTVTARISGLEAEIGQKLLHRNKSGAELTSPGFKFRRYAELMVQLWSQARSEVSLPEGLDGICNVGLEFDLWTGFGERLLAHMRAHNPGIALAFWPGEQRMLDRWLSIGLVDIAFGYAPQSGDAFTSQALMEDELILVSRARMKSPRLDRDYIYVDHGDEVRRQHAAAYPSDVTAALVIASSDWALDLLLRHGGSGYLPQRHVAAHLKAGKLHAVPKAPRFSRRIYVVQNAQTVRSWRWYPAALDAVRRGDQ